MGFSEENRILMENCYVLMVMEQNLIKEFRIKAGDCGEWTNEKAARNWPDGRQTKRQHWKHTEYFLFFYCV